MAYMPNTSAIDGLLNRLAGVRMWDAMQELSRTRTLMGRRALESLTAPRAAAAIEAAEAIAGERGYRLGRPLGAGAESLVWEAEPTRGGLPHVLKLQSAAYGVPRGMQLPPGIPNVAGYAVRELVGPNTLMGLQPRAIATFSPSARSRPGGVSLEADWANAARLADRTLASQGVFWDDRHAQNIGVMADGTWGVIDGTVRRGRPLPMWEPEDAIDLAARGLEPRRAREVVWLGGTGEAALSPEEAASILRLTEQDRRFVEKTTQP